MTFTIEKNIPLPGNSFPRQKSELRDAMHALLNGEIGDSLFVPNRKRSSLYTRRHDFGIPPHVFSMRNVEGGVRIWKVAEPEK